MKGRVRLPIIASRSAMSMVRIRAKANYEMNEGVCIEGDGQGDHLASACRYFLFHDSVITASS